MLLAANLQAEEIQYRDYTIRQEGNIWHVYEDGWRVPEELDSLPEAKEFIDWLEHGNC